jgi:hypothetical protein
MGAIIISSSPTIVWVFRLTSLSSSLESSEEERKRFISPSIFEGESCSPACILFGDDDCEGFGKGDKVVEDDERGRHIIKVSLSGS